VKLTSYRHRAGPGRPQPGSPGALLYRAPLRVSAFCVDAMSSTVNLNVDLDVMLAVLAQAFTPRRLPGYNAVTPDTIQRRFTEPPGQLTATPDAVTVQLERRAFSPVLRKTDPPPATPAP
jgi:hypothetical protein